MDDLLKLMKERRSTRVPFDMNRPVPGKDLQQILDAARWTPTAHNMQNFEIIVVDDTNVIQSISKIKRPISEIFIRENYPLLSFSEEELGRRKTGILGTVFPESWRHPDFNISDRSEEELASMQRPFPASPLMLVVVYDPSHRAPASEGDFLGIISLGCAMENMWLMASSLGIGFHILSSLSSEPVVGEVKRILKIPLQLTVAFTCRLGYPREPLPAYLRVRRDVDDFVHHNGW